MSESFSIQVTDGIQPSIVAKLEAIAKNALDAFSNIEKLQAALSKAGGGGLVSAQSTLASALDKTSDSYLKQETALNKAIAAESKAATANEQFAQSAIRTETAINNLVASELRGVAASENLIREQAKAAAAVTANLTAQEKLTTATANTTAAQSRAASAAVGVTNANTRLVASEAALEAATNRVIASAIGVTREQQRLTTATIATAAADQRLQAATAGTATAQARAQTAIVGTTTAQQRLATATVQTATAQTQGVTATTLAAAANQRLQAALAATAAAQARAAIAQQRLNTLQNAPPPPLPAPPSAALIDGITNLTKQFLGFYAIYRTVKQTIGAADEFTNLQNRLKAVSAGYGDVDLLSLKLLHTANESRASLKEVGELFSRLRLALKDVGGSEAEAIRLTETLTKVTHVNGLTTNEQSAALLQVSQAFTKGKLNGDDFRSVVSSMPQFVNALVQVLGLANKGLIFEAAKEGRITLDVMRQAAGLLGDTIDRQVNTSTITVSASFQQLSNSTTVLIGFLNKATGATSFLARGLDVLRHAADQAIAALNRGPEAKIANNESLLASIDKDIAGLDKSSIAYGLTLRNLQKSRAEVAGELNTLRSQLDESSFNKGLGGIEEALEGDIAKRTKTLISGRKILEEYKIGGKKINEEKTEILKTYEELKKIPFANLQKEEADFIKTFETNREKLFAAIDKKHGFHEPKVPKPPAHHVTPEEHRSDLISHVTLELDKQAKSYDQVAEKRHAQQRLDEIDIKLATRRADGKHFDPLTDKEKAEFERRFALQEREKRITTELDAVYNHAVGPLRHYSDSIVAIGIAVKNKNISEEQGAIATRRNEFEYKTATDNLFAYNRQTQQHNLLLGKSIDERHIEQAVLAESNRLLPTGKKLREDEEKTIRASTAALIERERIVRQLDSIESATIGHKKELEAAENALKQARDKEYFSFDVYKQKTIELNTAFLHLQDARGFGTFESGLRQSLNRILAGFTNLRTSLGHTFGGLFSQISEGFNKSFGDAIFKGGSLKESLQSLAQSVGSDLVASLLKVGEQYLINEAVSKGFISSAIAGNITKTGAEEASIAAITAAKVTSGQVLLAAAAEVAIGLAAVGAAIAAAWAPAAAAVSLASYGANAIPADAAITSAYALSKALSSPVGFEEGGYTGDLGTKEIAGVVHGQEFVANAAATARNRSTLEAMNRGERVGGVSVEIHNYGTPQNYEVQQISESQIRLIARDESRNVVRKEAPRVVANDMNNPNSQTSKSINRNTNTTRKR